VLAEPALPHITKLLIYTPFIFSVVFTTKIFSIPFWESQAPDMTFHKVVDVWTAEWSKTNLRRFSLMLSDILDRLEDDLRGTGRNPGLAGQAGLKGAVAMPFKKLHFSSSRLFLIPLLLDELLSSQDDSLFPDDPEYGLHADLGPISQLEIGERSATHSLAIWTPDRNEEVIERFLQDIRALQTPHIALKSNAASNLSEDVEFISHVHRLTGLSYSALLPNNSLELVNENIAGFLGTVQGLAHIDWHLSLQKINSIIIHVYLVAVSVFLGHVSPLRLLNMLVN
jgi:hypothetical protein